MTVQTPTGGPDVTRRNKQDVLYIEGDGLVTTPAAQRIRKPTGTDPVVAEKGVDGVFNPTTWKFGSGSVQIGESFSISGAGGNIRTRDDAEVNPELFALVPGIQFDAEGTDFLTVPFLDQMISADIFPGPTTSQLTATTIGVVIPAGNRRLLEIITHEAGSTGASAPVQYTVYVGSDNTGQKLFEQNFAASVFAADLPIVIPILSTTIFEENVTHFLEMTSSIALSVDLNTLGQVITKFEFHNSKKVGVFTENQMLDEDLNLMFDLSLNPMYAKQFI